MSDSHKTPVILSFEASASLLSAAVYANNGLVAMQQIESCFGQASGLVPLAVNALAESGIDFSELTHVAAGRGPGSFTGIRVALAAAKGVCLAHDHPAQIFTANMMQQGKIFEAKIDQLPLLVPASIYTDGLVLLGHGSFEAAEAFADKGIKARPAIYGNDDLGDNYGTFLVDAGMIAKLAAQKIMGEEEPPLTPLYLADARLGPKKKKSAK